TRTWATDALDGEGVAYRRLTWGVGACARRRRIAIGNVVCECDGLGEIYLAARWGDIRNKVHLVVCRGASLLGIHVLEAEAFEIRNSLIDVLANDVTFHDCG